MIGGSGRTVDFDLAKEDIGLEGELYGYGVLPRRQAPLTRPYLMLSALLKTHGWTTKLRFRPVL